MRKHIFATGLTSLLCTWALAQTAVTRTYIKGGKDAWANYLQEIYLNPTFEPGMVEYKNGKKYKSLLNYNRALAAVQFIDEKGDTLALNDDDRSVSTVTIGETLFYMDPVCIQLIAENDKIRLGKNETTRQADKQKKGALGIANSAGTIDSYDRTYSRNNHYIDVDEELLMRKTTTYYFAAKDDQFMPVSKRNVLNKYSHAQKEINKFIQEKVIDFNDEADLLKLTDFLATL